MALNWFTEDKPATATPACSTAQSRFHAIVAAMEAEFEAAWPSLSTVERQYALTALAQAKQFEVLLSTHVVQPEDALGHKHNSLVAGVAQSVLVNSLKADRDGGVQGKAREARGELMNSAAIGARGFWCEAQRVHEKRLLGVFAKLFEDHLYSKCTVVRAKRRP
jgi:hypothetical protein